MQDCHSLEEMLCPGPDPDSLSHVRRHLPALGLQLHSRLLHASGLGVGLSWLSDVLPELFSTDIQQQLVEIDEK